MSSHLKLEVSRNNPVFETITSNGINGILPRHFVESTLPRIGGGVKGLYENENLMGCGFSLPAISSKGNLSYITRGYLLPGQKFDLPEDWLNVEEFRKNQFHEVVLSRKNGFNIAHPNRTQAEEAMKLQQQVWGFNASLYPYDLYRNGSGADTRLVALNERNETIGFLLGFIGFGEKWKGDKKGEKYMGFWVESQIAAVDERHKENGVAKALKWEQYDQAKKRGLKLIHWTVDPLQSKNAGLNFGLGAVAAEFTPNYYSFRNDINRVVASRFGVYWIVDSERAEKAKTGKLEKKNFFEIKDAEIIHPLEISARLENWHPTSKNILIEIPADWDGMQQNDLETAHLWRNTTDAIFSKIIGIGKGKYIITGRIYRGETPFLIAEEFNEVYK